MSAVGEYLVCVLAGALICGILLELVGKKSTNASLIRLLCGVFMTLCIVSPLLDIRIGPLADLTADIKQEADSMAADGKNMAQEQYRAVITQRTEAYILDKAESLGADVTVAVTLGEDDFAAPRAVTVRGRISPYAKGLLGNWLESNLGIAAEEQTWIASN